MTIHAKKTGVSFEEVLRETMREVEPRGPARWACSFRNGGAHSLGVSIAEGQWMILDTLLRAESAPAEWWEILRANPRLPGLSKVVLAANGRATRWRAELPLGGESDLGERLSVACADFPAALAACREPRRAFLPAAPAPAAPLEPADLEALCAEAGWACSRQLGSCKVELEGRRGVHQAHLEVEAGGSLRAGVDLVAGAAWSVESRWALAALLLSASRVVRMARARARESGVEWRAGFEVRFGAPPSAFELGRGLGALAAACELAADEARVLEDAAVARAYLDQVIVVS